MKAAKLTTETSHAVFPITKDLLQRYYSGEEKAIFQTENDTALLISAQFFHTNSHQDKFEHL